MIDAGVNGICILANYSEQFALTDDEREQLTTLIIDHVAGRVPIIVTTTHFSTRIAAERSRRAQQAGAQMVMLMPPYHGATLRADEAGGLDYFRAVADAIDIPIMIQDAPMAGTTLSAPFLARLAREIPQRPLLQDRDRRRGQQAACPDPPRRRGDRRPVRRRGVDHADARPRRRRDRDDAERAGPRRCCGSSCDRYLGGQRDAAIAVYERWLPLINYENKQCGLRATKALMQAGGIIASDAVRHPLTPLPEPIRAGLLELARRRDPLVLRWSR